jgi:hypothetical protein
MFPRRKQQDDELALWKEQLLLVGILCLGAFLRLYRLDLTWFHGDQARDVSIASSIALGRSLPLLGPIINQTQAALGPLYFYLMALPYVFSSAPIAGASFIAGANIIALFLCYRFVRMMFGPDVALKATALFAVFPLAVLSSRSMWNPGWLPLFTILFFRALYSVVVRGHSGSIIAVFSLLAILVQLHLTAVSFAVVTLVALMVFRPRVRVSHLVIGGSCVLLLTFPYLVYELTHQFGNTRMIFRATAMTSLAEHRPFPALLTHVASLFLPSLNGFVTTEQWTPLFLKGFVALYRIEAVLFVVGVVICLQRVLSAWRTGKTGALQSHGPIVLLLMWLVVPIVILGSKRVELWWYYLDLLYPSQFIFAAIALASLPQHALIPAWAREGVARGALGLLLSILLFQSLFQIALQQKIDGQGAIVVDLPKLYINPPRALAAGPNTVTALTLGHRSRILRTLLEEFEMDAGAFPGRVHGAVLGVPSESEYVVRYLASQVTGDHRKRASLESHYLVVGGDRGGPSLDAIRSKRVNPYILVEYRPTIDYQSWQYAIVQDWRRDGAHVPSWNRLELPGFTAGLDLREGEVLVCKGIVRGPSLGTDGKMVVGISAWWAPVKVTGVWINGKRFDPLSQEVRLGPFYWMTETIVDLKRIVVPGGNLVRIEVGGPGHLIGLDVHEG